MLAQNFKTAAELGLADIELESLIKVLGIFERGEVREGTFDMSDVMHPCGTPSCICGWTTHVSLGNAFPLAPEGPTGWLAPDWEQMPRALQDLFGYQPGSDDAVPDNVFEATVEEAASALRNYLTLGEPRWAEVLA